MLCTANFNPWGILNFIDVLGPSENTPRPLVDGANYLLPITQEHTKEMDDKMKE